MNKRQFFSLSLKGIGFGNFLKAWEHDIFKDYTGKVKIFKRLIIKETKFSRKNEKEKRERKEVNFHVMELPALILQLQCD